MEEHPFQDLNHHYRAWMRKDLARARQSFQLVPMAGIPSYWGPHLSAVAP